MINTQMRNYDYLTLGGNDAYGQPLLTEEVKGQVKMAIHLMSESLSDSSLYSGAQYVGLTLNAIDDTYVIKYGDERLKVLYINPEGRCKQVFMARM